METTTISGLRSRGLSDSQIVEIVKDRLNMAECYIDSDGFAWANATLGADYGWLAIDDDREI